MNTLGTEEIKLAEQTLAMALEKGAQKARVVLNKSLMDLIGTLNGEIDKVSHCLDRSLSISLFVDGRFGSFSTNKLEMASLEPFIEKAIATTRMLAEDQWRTLPDPSRTATNAVTGRELDLYDNSYETMTPEQRIKMALDASIFKDGKDPLLISEEAEYSDSVFDSLIIDSNGLRCRHTETSFEYGVEMTIQDQNGDRYTGYWWDATPRLQDLKISECCPTALKRARAQMNPQDHDGGKMNMVISSECASKVVTPLLNALSAYAIQQNNSFLVDSLDQKKFSEGFTIRDCCHNIGETGSRLYDSEGVATVERNIIEGGVVKQYFVNTYMSGKMGIAPTIEDATRPRVMPWPQAGLSCDDLMAKCGSGILVTSFNGGNSNSSTGDFSYGIEGFAFQDGKITHPVREMLVTGNFLNLWNNLIAVADDARLCMSKLIPTLAFSNVDFSA